MGCVPLAGSQKTLRQRVWTQGTFHTGTLAANNAFGFIIVDPINAQANDRDCVIQSTSAYALGTVGDLSNAGTVGNQSNSEFPAAAYGPANDEALARIVGAGLRVRYSGPRQYIGGTVTVLSDPEHNTLFGKTPTQIADSEQHKRFIPEDGGWMTCLYFPHSTGDNDLGVPAFANPNNLNINSNRFYMGMAVNGAIDNAAFSYEFFVVYEIAGSHIRGVETTHGDPVALAAACTVGANTYPSTSPPDVMESQFFNKAANYILDGISGAVNLAQNGARVYKAASIAAPIIMSLL